MFATRSRSPMQALSVATFESYLREGKIQKAMDMLDFEIYHLHADTVKPVFIKVAGEKLGRCDIITAINLLDTFAKVPKSEHYPLEYKDLKDLRPKVIAGVGRRLTDGLMMGEDTIRSVLSARVPLRITKKDLKPVFLEGIRELVDKGWPNATVKAVGIALYYLDMKLENIKPVIRKAMYGLSEQGYAEDAEKALSLLRMTKPDFLAEIYKDRVSIPADPVAVQLRLIG